MIAFAASAPQCSLRSPYPTSIETKPALLGNIVSRAAERAKLIQLDSEQKHAAWLEELEQLRTKKSPSENPAEPPPAQYKYRPTAYTLDTFLSGCTPAPDVDISKAVWWNGKAENIVPSKPPSESLTPDVVEEVRPGDFPTPDDSKSIPLEKKRKTSKKTLKPKAEKKAPPPPLKEIAPTKQPALLTQEELQLKTTEDPTPVTVKEPSAVPIKKSATSATKKKSAETKSRNSATATEESSSQPPSKDPATQTDGSLTGLKAFGAGLLDAIVEGVDTKEEVEQGKGSRVKGENISVQKGIPESVLAAVEGGKLKALTVTKLRRMLSECGLKTSGRKSELIARLTSYVRS